MGLAFKHLFFLNHIVTLRMFSSTIKNSVTTLFFFVVARLSQVTTLFDVLLVVTLSILLIMVFAHNFFSLPQFNRLVKRSAWIKYANPLHEERRLKHGIFYKGPFYIRL